MSALPSSLLAPLSSATPPTPRRRDLSRLLAPRSIAVFGASDRAGNLGKTVISHLLKFGFPGTVSAVHPTLTDVGGVPCHPDIASIPQVPDLVVFAVSAQGLLAAVDQAITAGVHCGIALAGGFSEGGEEGHERQAQLEKLCADSGFVLCGPNCIGLINTGLPMAATFASALLATDQLMRGNISVISQSGGIATFTQSLEAAAGYGVRYVVSSGNEAVTTTADYITAFSQDELTSVICVYIEGLKDAALFTAALGAARAAGKMVVLLKAGATAQSAMAAMAHTGALAGEDRVWNAVLRSYGVVRVDSLEEMLDDAMYLSGRAVCRLPQGTGIALVGFGGGGGVLGADQCVVSGLKVAVLQSDRVGRLRHLVPPIAAITNPFDLTPDSYNKPEWFARFPEALDEISQDPGVDIVLVQVGATAHKADVLVDAILALVSRTSKSVAVAWTLAPPTAVARLQQAGLHVFAEQARALRTLGRVAAAVKAGRRSVASKPALATVAAFDWQRWVPSATAGTVVSEHECHAIFRFAGLPVAAGRFFGDLDKPDAAPLAAAEVGYPLAMKGISTAVTHRAAVGLVALGINSASEAQATAERFRKTAANLGVTLDGIYAQKMVEGGVELIIGASRDPVFGIVISAGAGGVLTELLDDVAIGTAPVSPDGAREMLERLRIVRHALGKQAGLDLQPVIDFIVRFSSVAASAPWSQFALEVNPIKWTPAGATAVDGLLVIGAP